MKSSSLRKLASKVRNLSRRRGRSELDELTSNIALIGKNPLDPASKLQVWPILDALVSIFGFAMYNRSLAWINEDEFNCLWNNSPFVGKQRKDRKFLAYSAIKSVRHIDGDTVECGVFDGATSYIIMTENLKTGKTHYMFDSWEGLSEPDAIDRNIPPDSAYVWGAGDLSVDINKCRSNLEHFYRKAFFKGWIPHEFHHVSERSFSFVHVDVDLYKPTLHSLHFFWPRLKEGGVLLCDDYGFESCPGARQACDEFFSQLHPPRQMLHVPTGQGIIYK
jgi:hypothetical protein